MKIWVSCECNTTNEIIGLRQVRLDKLFQRNKQTNTNCGSAYFACSHIGKAAGRWLLIDFPPVDCMRLNRFVLHVLGGIEHLPTASISTATHKVREASPRMPHDGVRVDPWVAYHYPADVVSAQIIPAREPRYYMNVFWAFKVSPLRIIPFHWTPIYALTLENLHKLH